MKLNSWPGFSLTCSCHCFKAHPSTLPSISAVPLIAKGAKYARFIYLDRLVAVLLCSYTLLRLIKESKLAKEREPLRTKVEYFNVLKIDTRKQILGLCIGNSSLQRTNI